eukprot:CAMPEP_0202458488 /NCGR_PEP_ID=MMETSP1360-20130828/26003_1 /ASSEMBLY_ACC=CAM_ASM_000848 /TAXON_ID=515479 /ORGANISM="Licmophora paradoxa, Strain CCMP2313" /LENGTH=175 /DNA_ID=CAMNT_0049079065 /DNA_START=154 /DNA_END=678 /DNA_ORIENTATION=+
MATTVPTSTNISGDGCVEEGGRDTSTLAGDASTKRSSVHKQMPSRLQVSSKRSMESASSSDLNSSDTSNSSGCAKKKRRKNRPKVPTENHLKIRAVVDAGDKWELELEEVHGLTDEEACVVVSIVAKHYLKDEFPENGDRFVKLAKKGWELSNENARLHKLCPECHDQTKIDGVW